MRPGIRSRTHPAFWGFIVHRVSGLIPGDLPTSAFTQVRRAGDALAVSFAPVQCTRVRPGESLLRE